MKEFKDWEEQAIQHTLSDIAGHCRDNIYQVTRRMVGELPLPYPADHLATVARFVHVLAYRVFNCHKHPAAADGWRASDDDQARANYIDYVKTVLHLNDAINAAAKSRRLRLHDRVSSVVLDDWNMPDKDAAVRLEAALKWDCDDRAAAEILSTWPIWYPHISDSIVVEPRAFCAWAESENIAAPGETMMLLDALQSADWWRRSYLGFPKVIHPLPPMAAALSSLSDGPVPSGGAEANRPAAVPLEPLRHKLRRRSLDAPIEKAMRTAGGEDTAAVFGALRELALCSEPPFTGLVKGAGLCYTNDNNEPAVFTKAALGRRLSRAKQRQIQAIKSR